METHQRGKRHRKRKGKERKGWMQRILMIVWRFPVAVIGKSRIFRITLQAGNRTTIMAGKTSTTTTIEYLTLYTLHSLQFFPRGGRGCVGRRNGTFSHQNNFRKQSNHTNKYTYVCVRICIRYINTRKDALPSVEGFIAWLQDTYTGYDAKYCD